MCSCLVALSCSRCDVVNPALQIRCIGRRSAVAFSSPIRPITADAPVSDVRHEHRSDTNSGRGVPITDLYKYSPDAVPPIHAVSYHVATDKPPPKMATSSGLFLATIYNQSQLTERKHVARYWSINTAATAVLLSAHPSPIEVAAARAKQLAASMLGGGCMEEVFCRPSTPPVVPISGLLPSVDHCLVKNDDGVGGECDAVAVVMVTNMKMTMIRCLCEMQMIPAVNAAMCQVPQMPYGMYANYQPQVHVKLLPVVSLTCRVCYSHCYAS